MKKLYLPLFISIITVLFGCATGSAIITGQVRPALNPTEVKIYLNPPSQYETIGIIEASSDVEFFTQAAQNRVIENLKKQAAKIGANGILLRNTGSVFYDNGSTKTAQGEAIYVIKE